MSQQPDSSLRMDCPYPTAVTTQYVSKLKFKKAICAPSVWNGQSCSRTGDAGMPCPTCTLGNPAPQGWHLFLTCAAQSCCSSKQYELSQFTYISPSRIPDKKWIGEPISYPSHPVLKSLASIADLKGLWSLIAFPAWHRDAVAEPTPFCTLLSKQGSEERGNTVALLTRNSQCGAKEGSQRCLYIRSEQSKEISSSHPILSPSRKKGWKTAAENTNKNLDRLRFI